MIKKTFFIGIGSKETKEGEKAIIKVLI